MVAAFEDGPCFVNPELPSRQDPVNGRRGFAVVGAILDITSVKNDVLLKIVSSAPNPEVSEKSGVQISEGEGVGEGTGVVDAEGVREGVTEGVGDAADAQPGLQKLLGHARAFAQTAKHHSLVAVGKRGKHPVEGGVVVVHMQ